MEMPRSQDGRWTATCEVCGNEFQQRRPGIRTCGVKCRAQLPHNTGGVRAKAGMWLRICQNPECGKEYQPVRESQVACSPACLLKVPASQEARRRSDNRPERRAAQNARRNLATTSDVEKRKFINLRGNMRQQHGIDITWAQYSTWAAWREKVCALCGALPPDDRDLHVDHDHTTGRLRDYLCWNCNRGLGAFQDDPALLRAAAAYIERHRALAAQMRAEVT